MNSKNKYENIPAKTKLDNKTPFQTKPDVVPHTNTQTKLSIRQRIFNRIVAYIDYYFLKYLTVERSRNRRKYIWKTKTFREVVFLHIPRMLFIFGMVYACHKINNRAKKFKNTLSNEVEIKSEREDNIDKQKKVLQIF